MTKKRLIALDGLRGFAALCVVISHLNFKLRLISQSSIINYLFRMISSGPSSVQLFFVLSGFLISFLYPVVKDNWSFWGKRYLRIMPVFGAVVLLEWLSRTHLVGYSPYIKLLAILIIGLAIRIIWKLLEYLHKYWRDIGWLIFSLVVIFQICWFGISLLSSFSGFAHYLANFNSSSKALFIMLSNLTMTMYWQPELFILGGMFWSLMLEVFFYQIYPIVVTPLIAISKRLKLFAQLGLIILIITLLFDFDLASRAMYFVHGTYIARASGFVIGVALGRLYANKSRWSQLARWLKKPLLNYSIFILFFISMALEWPDRYHQIRQYVGLHYLLLSLLFGSVLISSLTAKTLANRFFSQKYLRFLGTISYSLYLIHDYVIKRFHDMRWMGKLEKIIHPIGLSEFIRALILVIVSIIMAAGLYWLVESLYFASKKHSIKSSKKVATQILVKKSFYSKLFSQRLIAVFIAIGISLGITFFYAGDYSPSLLISRQVLRITPPWQSAIIKVDQPIEFTFTARYPNLSVVLLDMDYAYDPNISRTEITKNTQLIFELKDENDKSIIQSVRQPQELEGEPQYPFGFPTIAESQGKKYQVSLRLQQANPTDEVFIYQHVGVITQYTNQVHGIVSLVKTIMARLIFAIAYWPTLLSLMLTWIVAIIYWHKNDKHKINS